MPNRAQRRVGLQKAFAATHKAKAIAPLAPPPTDPTATATESSPISEPGAPFPSLAKLSANRANAQLSTGPKPESFPITSQNRILHGLARHNGAFKIMTCEDASGFTALKQSLLDEHKPTTPTESILVNTMAEAHWLANRAQRLQDNCFDEATGEIANAKMFALFLRYQTTHTRAFHKSLNDLLRLRAAARKEALGFEAQRIQNERHEMKKQHHYWDVLRKDGQACAQIAQNTLHNLNAAQEHSGFEAQFAADLAQLGLKRGDFQIAVPAAA